MLKVSTLVKLVSSLKGLEVLLKLCFIISTILQCSWISYNLTDFLSSLILFRIYSLFISSSSLSLRYCTSKSLYFGGELYLTASIGLWILSYLKLLFFSSYLSFSAINLNLSSIFRLFSIYLSYSCLSINYFSLSISI